MPQINTTGRHEATVKSSQFGESKTGTPFFEIAFENDKGETISGWLYLSEGAFNNTVKTLRDAFGFNNDFETLPAQVSGKRCAITIEEEEFEKKMRLKVKWINSLRSVIPLKDGGALKKFSQQAARLPVEQRTAAKPAPKAPAAAKDEDPFFPSS